MERPAPQARRTRRVFGWLLIAVAQGLGPSAVAGEAISRDRAVIPAGGFYPQYGPGGSKRKVEVAAFSLDRLPVTQAEYEAFLRANPSWRPGAVKALFAERDYLKDWAKNGKGPAESAPARDKRRHPVVFVSYFAAEAFCEWVGGRLPTTIEWEYAAQEDIRTQLQWFTRPEPPKEVGKGKANHFGISDLHGQVWEWTLDFNSSFATADNRQDGQMDKNFFCGAGAMNAKDRENYPAFMRYAMRGGLRGNYTVSNLGFRCAYDEK